VRRLQVHEEEGDKLRVLLEVKYSPCEAERNRLLECLREVTRNHYEIVLQIVPEIAPAANGKHQFIVPLPRPSSGASLSPAQRSQLVSSSLSGLPSSA
jgi:hypothetical protein